MVAPLSTPAAPSSPAAGASHSAHDTMSIPFLLVAAAIIAAGVLLYTEFMWTFNLVYLSSVLFFLVGGLMLFHPRSGPDSSG